MIVDTKKESSVSWRQDAEDIGLSDNEIAGRPPDREHLGLIKVDDPVEILLDSYDFSALHDRIMMAVAAKPMKSSSRKEKLS